MSKFSFLEYYKTILSKVSFDKDIFNKEYKKAINCLSRYEKECLDKWLWENKLDKILHPFPKLEAAKLYDSQPTTTFNSQWVA
ncbi:hypothetical protein R9C00_02795 [Flammeovirgaceae bacterium SG7u.111]|nr:hypothetical protein [Flammeovirgaceae bacterium SG7u.132]WPO36368.1 hypothetical protein R9C00_02795 [Flammeovirgaceae bacterium SG7u.111]